MKSHNEEWVGTTLSNINAYREEDSDLIVIAANAWRAKFYQNISLNYNRICLVKI